MLDFDLTLTKRNQHTFIKNIDKATDKLIEFFDNTTRNYKLLGLGPVS